MLRNEKDTEVVRVLKLAAIYGPFVRFTPDGNEGDGEGEGEGDTLDNAIKEGEKAAKTPEEQAAIDTARKAEQQLEQERANTRRANETATTAQAELEVAQAETEKLQEKLEAAQAKAAEAGITDVELNEDDYTGTDLVLVRSIKALQEGVKAKDQRIAGLEKKATDFEEKAQIDSATAASNSAYEELLTDLDAEYGADCRNEAVKAFNALAAEGKVEKGKPAKTTRLLEKCYKDAKAAKAKDKTTDKSRTDLDTGSGGGSAPNLTDVEIKDGSLDDVAKHYGQALKGAKLKE